MMAGSARSGWGLAALCLGVLALPAPARAADYTQKQGPAEVRIQAEVDKEGRVHVRLSGAVLTVSVQGKAPLKVKWDEAVTKSEDWTVTKLGPVKENKEHTSWEQRFRLEPPAKTGDIAPLQLLPLSYSEGKQPEKKVDWKPIRVWVPKPSLAQMRPNTPPEEVPPASSWYQPLAWIGIGLVLAALGLVVWELVRRRFRRAVPLTPDAWALRELDTLAALDLPQGGEVERFTTLLSDVARRYLELRFRLPATRQTTVEFLETMQKSPHLTVSQQVLLREFLHLCDLAKFARAELSVDNCRNLTAEARSFVQQSAVPATPAGVTR
jgi:Domain of unknown function (DUF4381)